MQYCSKLTTACLCWELRELVFKRRCMVQLEHLFSQLVMIPDKDNRYSVQFYVIS